MDIEDMDFVDVFEHLVENCDRERLLGVCEEHIDETEGDDELAEFIAYVLKHREGARSLVLKQLGGDKA